jgi:hypothetical protein
MSDTLPQIIGHEGEVVRLISAEHLLEAAGLADLRDAEVVALAQFTDNADHLAAIAREAKGTVSEELVHRLDKRGKWTLHEAGFTIKTSSPEAGTVAYDTDRLRTALDGLLAADEIDREAADAALEPKPGTVPVSAEDIAALRAGFSDAATPEEAAFADELLAWLAEQIPATTYSQKPAGIKALLKRGGHVAAAIEECQVTVEPPKRTAKVTRRRDS